jgi:aryl-alcohol dehydrogenase-like predicted oxidoreductase
MMDRAPGSPRERRIDRQVHQREATMTSTPTVPRRRWGRSNLSIPVIPFGTQGFGNMFGPVAEAEAADLIRRAIELGVNHFDCARCYGDSLGKLRAGLRGVDRANVIVSGRVCLHQDRGDALHPARPRQPADWLPPADADAIVRDVEEQLAFLEIGYFDALLIHDPPDMERCLRPGGALEGALRLKARGLVRHVGFGMRPHDFHRQAIETGAVDVLLCFNDYNLLRQTAAEGVLPLAAQHDIGVLNGFSIVRGILTGADPDAAAARGRWGNAEDVARARAMRQWCLDRGISLLALALQFCLREERIHGNPLGSQNRAELEANVAAVLTPLPEAVFADFAAAGL